MNLIVGSKYWETRERLEKRIRENNIKSFEAEGSGHMCYFCRQGIEGKMRVLIDEDKTGNATVEFKYYADNFCYLLAKLYSGFGRIPLFLN